MSLPTLKIIPTGEGEAPGTIRSSNFFSLQEGGGLGVRSRFQDWRVPASKPDSTDGPPGSRIWCTLTLSQEQTPSIWRGAEVWRGRCQLTSSSSSDHGIGGSRNAIIRELCIPILQCA
ncbi:hypothetical protein AVEN_98355-1 [Araneus ventricosus]|uniref:Uncharacterized protein n=1 Tax=Araneus ventricosus TaxID=182803 RepID=A0A4Y2NCH4_ARAVE|nr:hypothetical protein AVEN_98355-1 [Araneus ventricosus]